MQPPSLFAWHALSTQEAIRQLEVDNSAFGLSEDAISARRIRYMVGDFFSPRLASFHFFHDNSKWKIFVLMFVYLPMTSSMSS